jgi:transposase-like protein
MTTAKRYYTTDFKIKAVELSNLKGSVNQVAKELDIPFSQQRLPKHLPCALIGDVAVL